MQRGVKTVFRKSSPILLILILACLLYPALTSPAQAQSPIIVGVDNDLSADASCQPFLCPGSVLLFMGQSFVPAYEYQQVYPASAFGSPISITELAFPWNSVFSNGAGYTGGGTTSGQYQISLSTTSKTAATLSTNPKDNLGPDNTLFANFAGGPNANPLLTIEAGTGGGTAFSYDPSKGNLLLDIVVAANQGFQRGGYEQADSTGVTKFIISTVPGQTFDGIKVPVTTSSGAGLVTEFNGSVEISVNPQVFFGALNPAIAGNCNCSAFSGSGSGFSGDPVNTLNGNLSEVADDLVVPGRGRFLSLGRTYNAQAAVSASAPGLFGYGWSDSYGASLSINSKTGAVTINQAGGSSVTFQPGKAGAYTAPTYVTAQLAAGSGGTFVFKLKNQLTDIFNSSGRLIEQTDRDGYVTMLTYSASGDLTRVTDPAGRALVFTTGSNGLVSEVQDPQGRKVTYTYNAEGDLISVVDVNGGVTGYTYDGSHRLLTTRNPNGGTTTNIYDSSSRVTRQTDPAGNVMSWSYTAAISSSNGSDTTTVTDGNGNTAVYKFTNYLLSSLTRGANSPAPSTWTYVYNSGFDLTSTTDPNGHLWKSTYDAEANRLSTSDPLGDITRWTYDVFNDPISSTDPLGEVTTLKYDSHGDLASISRPIGAKTQTTAFAHADSSHPGDVTSITDPDGDVTSFTYDAFGDLASKTDPSGDKTTYTYNRIGFVLTWATPLGNVAKANPSPYTTTFTYDNFGDLVTNENGLKEITRRTYDFNRNLISLTDPKGNKIQYTYSPDDLVVTITRADASALHNQYDHVNNLVAQIDGLGHATKYGFDAQNRMVKITDALGAATSFAYDAAGNRISRSDPPSNLTTFGYDAADRLISIGYSDGVTPNVKYVYNAAGERTAMTDGSGQTTYTYDSIHRLNSSTNGANQKVSYVYDLRGSPISITYPNGKTVTRTYDASGRLTAVEDWLGHTTRLGYDADSNLVNQTYPNGWNGSFSHDAVDELTGVSYVDGTHSLKFSYTRNEDELVSLEMNSASLPASTPPPIFPAANAITYDALNRVLADSGPASNYKYDNADRPTNNGGTGFFSYNPDNELININGGAPHATLKYDERGNRLNRGSATYSYDEANRLVAAASAAYRYNGDGLRMAKTIGSTTEQFAWETITSNPLLLQDGSTVYVYGPGGTPLEQISGTTALFYHSDQLGSVRMLSGSSGSVAATYSYDAYGNLVDSSATAQNPFRYGGQFTDAETGFQYLRARYYDPATQQFITRDPDALVTRELYTYVNDNPANLADPSGLDDTDSGSDFLPIPTGYEFDVKQPGQLFAAVVYTAYTVVADLTNLFVAGCRQPPPPAANGLSPGTNIQRMGTIPTSL
jgi:RHS repeat-associated protein